MIEVRIESQAVHTVIPIEVGITVVEATESVPPVKPAEAVECNPVTSEVETSETAEAEAMKSMETAEVTSTKVETTEMASSEVAATEVTTAETAGISDPGQCDHSRNERCGYERDKLTMHDTLLLEWRPPRRHRSAQKVAKLRLF
jgi:hypothetical protein